MKSTFTEIMLVRIPRRSNAVFNGREPKILCTTSLWTCHNIVVACIYVLIFPPYTYLHVCVLVCRHCTYVRYVYYTQRSISSIRNESQYPTECAVCEKNRANVPERKKSNERKSTTEGRGRTLWPCPRQWKFSTERKFNVPRQNDIKNVEFCRFV